ncbi:unnamed protein product [Blepharisma stoltei]|uniref:Uncharacterized protein n=1 Tax=Blepharisma stoltei TaxID=1481888 RepID=A0AAU9JLU9_9CILI|nr:unnamed protein product [Blepharisma stoltei]
MNPLLRNIPKGIKIARNPAVWGYGWGHTVVVNVLSLLFGGVCLSICFNQFPITISGSKQVDYEAIPDLATGQILTFQRTKLRYIDFI